MNRRDQIRPRRKNKTTGTRKETEKNNKERQEDDKKDTKRQKGGQISDNKSIRGHPRG